MHSSQQHPQSRRRLPSLLLLSLSELPAAALWLSGAPEGPVFFVSPFRRSLGYRPLLLHRCPGHTAASYPLASVLQGKLRNVGEL